MQHDAAYLQLKALMSEQWDQEEVEAEAKLKALREKYGKPPNIIFILADDIGHADVGCFGGGINRGTLTPNLDNMADEGMMNWGFYSEPSCTPSRVGIMTGRHPVRTGLTEVLFPGATAGLVAEEVSIASLLNDAGYATAQHGKWHLGDFEQHQPYSHGFEECYYTLYNAAPWVFGDKEMDFFAWPESKEFEEKYPVHGILEYKPGYKEPKEVAKLSLERILVYDAELADKTIDFIKRKAKGDKPFFVYHCASKLDYWGPHPDFKGKSPKGSIFYDSMMEHDDNVGRILQAIRDEGIEENTLVVWMSDNGPMFAFGVDRSGYHWLRGGKGDILEGGMRVPAIAWWPGMIGPGQAPGPMDIISITDMYTTAARLGGALESIPDDRIIDGVDQTCFLLNGEDHARRDYMIYYSGTHLGAIRKRNFKMHITEGHGGMPGGLTYDIIDDPREEHPNYIYGMSVVVPFQDLVSEHMRLVQKYPNRDLPPSPGAGIFDHD